MTITVPAPPKTRAQYLLVAEDGKLNWVQVTIAPLREEEAIIAFDDSSSNAKWGKIRIRTDYDPQMR